MQRALPCCTAMVLFMNFGTIFPIFSLKHRPQWKLVIESNFMRSHEVKKNFRFISSLWKPRIAEYFSGLQHCFSFAFESHQGGFSQEKKITQNFFSVLSSWGSLEFIMLKCLYVFENKQYVASYSRFSLWSHWSNLWWLISNCGKARHDNWMTKEFRSTAQCINEVLVREYKLFLLFLLFLLQP